MYWLVRMLLMILCWPIAIKVIMLVLSSFVVGRLVMMPPFTQTKKVDQCKINIFSIEWSVYQDCSKLLVKYNVILWRNKFCLWIAIKNDIAGMMFGMTNIDTTIGTWFPFWYIVVGSVLFKNVDGASKNMNVSEMVRRFVTCAQFVRTFVFSSSYGFQIMKTNSVFESKCPELGSKDIRPMCLWKSMVQAWLVMISICLSAILFCQWVLTPQRVLYWPQALMCLPNQQKQIHHCQIKCVLFKHHSVLQSFQKLLWIEAFLWWWQSLGDVHRETCCNDPPKECSVCTGNWKLNQLEMVCTHWC